MGKSMVVALFRHGLTKENEQRAYIGWLDSPLSEKGRYQLMNKKVNKQYDQIFSSDLLRAKQTVTSIFPNRKAITTSMFREMHFGEWEGKTYEQLKNDQVYCEWISNPFAIQPPNGESFTDFAKRVEKGWDLLIEASESAEKAAVVAHGGVIRYLLQCYGPDVNKGFFENSVETESGFELIWNDMDQFRRRKRCTSLQEAALMEKGNGH
ncbi:histidine phosphatase family protein [Niallia nealsonii]|uniref:Histidine phosphatase family protein n=1 Tax=Niallia nealsonii TaxID=115979 RepID=A0A2N0Z2G0_9BACI|nr:histidine phosphatase family protein [Niallia nealsonii]PKG23701.1 histidine phosphatase family protein [Niallia nealsonii]